MNSRFIKSHKNQTHVEEILNSLTHVIGALLGVAALVLLTVMSHHQHSALKVVASVIFGSSLIFMYSASALYHGFRNPRAKRILKIIDHSSIYILIAGSYTPIVLILLSPAWGWSLFGVIWGMALLGLIFKFFATGKLEIVSTIAYVCMGWLALIAIKPLYDALPLHGFLWLVAGGVSYTLGVIFYVWNRLRFGHAIWHLFVLGGSICHFFLVLLYVIPAIPHI
jgi:hemolysin III